MSYTRALARGWWLIVIVFAVALGVTAWVTSRQERVYESSTQLLVAPSSEVRDTGELLRSLETLERRTIVATFARIATTRETRDLAAAALGQEERLLRRYRVTSSVIPHTNIIRIDVEGPDRQLVATVADAIAGVTATQARRMYHVYSLRSIAAAEAARRPAWPDPRRNYLVGSIIGLFLGLVGALVLEQFRSRNSV